MSGEDKFHDIEVYEGVSGNVRPDETKIYVFKAKEKRIYVMETRGSSDMYMTLYGPNDPNKEFDDDDDDGEGLNAKLTKELVPGDYYLRVHHVKSTESASYKLLIYTLTDYRF